jgi:hypothetical protein
MANATAGSYNVTASLGSLKATFPLTNTASASLCDVNRDGQVNMLGRAIMVNEALGGASP